MVPRETDRNSTGGRWTLPHFTFPDSSLLQSRYTTCCLSRSSFLPLGAFDYAGPSPSFALHWLHQSPGHPVYLTLLSFSTPDLAHFFFLPRLLLSYLSPQAILNLAQPSPSPESLFWSLIQFIRPFSGFLYSLCAYFMSIHPTVQWPLIYNVYLFLRPRMALTMEIIHALILYSYHLVPGVGWEGWRDCWKEGRES